MVLDDNDDKLANRIDGRAIWVPPLNPMWKLVENAIADSKKLESTMITTVVQARIMVIPTPQAMAPVAILTIVVCTSGWSWIMSCTWSPYTCCPLQYMWHEWGV